MKRNPQTAPRLEPARLRQTLVGGIDADVLAYTVGRDPELDLALLELDAIGTAAHVRMLARLRMDPPILQPADAQAVIEALIELMRRGRCGEFVITPVDQDVHLAIERALTETLGELGRRIHTGRSRNDQVALDLRLFAREQIDGMALEALALAAALLKLARRHARLPMVGRTHLQPAMPSSVGLWAAGYAEALMDDLIALDAAYVYSDRCPLGAAAGYGVPLPIDRELTARLLGFAAPVHTVFQAGLSRGKAESLTLCAAAQCMLSCSRLAEDLILFSMPEFGYFSIPKAFCTGSSIMPQKLNPDVLELVRGKTARVLSHELATNMILKGMAGGYNRDLQEIKAPFMEGLETTRLTLRVLSRLVAGVQVHAERLREGFSPAVFATDLALEKVAAGMPFRDAYRAVRDDLAALPMLDPDAAIARKTHLGATAGIDFAALADRARTANTRIRARRRRVHACFSRLLGVSYPIL